MGPIAENILAFFKKNNQEAVITFDKLPRSGGDRIYFRIRTEKKSYIATYDENVRESKTFLYFTGHFSNINSPVPEIYFCSEDHKMYVQQDFGPVSLLNELEKHGSNDYVYSLFQKSLKALAWMQIKGFDNLDYSYCLTSKKFGRQAILSDLLYFKYYFLDTLKIPYDKEKLVHDFEKLSSYLTKVEHKYFMFRDFQSRNIYIENNEVHFIDYQGGMKGALQYDVASLLWQARANLSDEWKDSLLGYYMDCVSEILGKEIDRPRFINQYNGYVLIRLMQVLGAYGFRGLFERKAQFLTSIPLALSNLKEFFQKNSLGISVPEFRKVLDLCVSDEVIEQFTPVQATTDTPLIVRINSFSYKKGIPEDVSGNGGGFVFDCRGILNPGRIEKFKTQTGRDKEVKDYLEQQTKMTDFLNSAFDIVDITVEDYIQREFSNLMISFGCTGGQHRSVYAADALARHLRNKFKVKVDVRHLIQDEKNWVNTPM